jgi:hypothetical protein
MQHFELRSVDDRRIVSFQLSCIQQWGSPSTRGSRSIGSSLHLHEREHAMISPVKTAERSDVFLPPSFGDAEHWRRRAAHTRAKASGTDEGGARERLLKVAAEYDRMAEDAQRRDLV